MKTFRDPDGFVFELEDRVYRAVHPAAWKTLSEFLDSPIGKEFLGEGKLVRTWQTGAPSNAGLDLTGREILEHEKVFPSYPSEWPSEMLHAAAALTLDLAEASLEAGFGLKDATPLNVLFRGPQPVFVDMLSFERRDPRDPIWLPYAQFVRTFLLPLAAERLGIGSPRRLHLACRDGMDPEELYSGVPFWKRLLPPYFSLVTMPSWWNSRAEGSEDLYRPRLTSDPDRAGFTLRMLFRGLRRQLGRLKPRRVRSHWSAYQEHREHYTEAQMAVKKDFVHRILSAARPSAVLDVGANTGEFSAIAARLGAETVAIDSDAPAVVENWRQAQAERLAILPLVVDFSRPTPAVGWRNGESASFLSRASGRFDVVMMLAVVHHLVATERIPLEEILAAARELTRDLLILEYVEPDDPMFRRLARGRDALYQHCTRDYFETLCARHFQVIHRQEIAGAKRTLYALRRPA